MESGRLETAPPGGGHLDTVRALHQTVVSLRTALEVSKNELKELREKYQRHSNCLEYTDIIEKLSLENHILRRKIIDSNYDQDKEFSTRNIKLEVTYSPTQNVDDLTSEVVIQTATSEAKSTPEALEADFENSENFCSSEILHEIQEEKESIPSELNVSAEYDSPVHDDDDKEDTLIEEPLSQVISYSNVEESPRRGPSFKTKLELLSKFDVRIKVRTLKEGAVSTTTSDSDTASSTGEEKKDKFGQDSRESNLEFKEKREHYEETEDPKGTKINLKSISKENIKMAVPNEGDVKSKADKFDVQVRITSEENLVVKENVERTRRKDTMNLDVDDLSLRSLSEGDNSVFSEGAMTPAEPPTADGEPGATSGNESEEVDDIELIFTTDESKDISNLQEDLVSIRETDTWGPSSASAHSTPVLIKFHTLDPDFQPGREDQENKGLQAVIADSSLRMKRVSLPSDKEIRHVAFNGKGSLDLPGRGILKSCDNKSDITLYKRSPNTSTRRLDSVDSLTCEYNRGLSFDNTKSSSFELGSSMDILQREESMDSFHRNSHLGHRFSIFAETDLTKCGISEDDLASNLNVRRNTCPNPFQYRPPPRLCGRVPSPRGVSRRPGGRESVRTHSAAQTDMSALPPRWTSDGYLAYKLCNPLPGGGGAPRALAPTLPARPPARRAPPAPARPLDDGRLLLSDIGFTSMVPELSRSADPVWAVGRRAHTDATSSTVSTSKYLSRGSSYRSPCCGADRGSDWASQAYAPSNRGSLRGWRSSLPDVRRETDDTDELLQEAETFVRRSTDNLRYTSLDSEQPSGPCGAPYLPTAPRQLRLGHAVKVITPHGRIAVGRVRYVGIAGGSAEGGTVLVGAEFPASGAALPWNDGTHRGRRYFLTNPHHTALFVPFTKVVMAWAT